MTTLQYRKMIHRLIVENRNSLNDPTTNEPFDIEGIADDMVALILEVDRDSRIAENQRYIDLADEFNNRKPKPGELTAASFGRAGAGMIASSYYNSFKDRIAALTNRKES